MLSSALTVRDIDATLNQWIRGGVDEFIDEEKGSLEVLKNLCLDDYPDRKAYKDIGTMFSLQSAFVNPCHGFFGRQLDSRRNPEVIYHARTRLYEQILTKMEELKHVDNKWVKQIQAKLTQEFAALPKAINQQDELVPKGLGLSGTFLYSVGYTIIYLDPAPNPLIQIGRLLIGAIALFGGTGLCVLAVREWGRKPDQTLRLSVARPPSFNAKPF